MIALLHVQCIVLSRLAALCRLLTGFLMCWIHCWLHCICRTQSGVSLAPCSRCDVHAHVFAAARALLPAAPPTMTDHNTLWRRGLLMAAMTRQYSNSQQWSATWVDPLSSSRLATSVLCSEAWVVQMMWSFYWQMMTTLYVALLPWSWFHAVGCAHKPANAVPIARRFLHVSAHLPGISSIHGASAGPSRRPVSKACMFAEQSIHVCGMQVQLRSSSRLPSLPDGGRNKRRLEAIRTALGWEEVPVLRNRSRALVFVESPWDSFGPVPPTDADMLGLDAD